MLRSLLDRLRPSAETSARTAPDDDAPPTSPVPPPPPVATAAPELPVEGDEIGAMTARREGSGPASWAENRWYGKHVNSYPGAQGDFDDLPRLIRECVLPGHAPAAPLLGAADNVVTLGSCFAAELRHFLNKFSFASRSFWIPSGLNNTFAILDFVSWCVTGNQTGRGYRYDRAEDGSIEEWLPSEERERYVEHLRQAGAFVFTLGLAEVWEDRETGAVFWRGVPESVFDSQRHVFRLTTVEENAANIRQIIQLIRQVNPDAPIILTLSPVPLKATFREISCLTADCVSKSVLRVALDLVVSEKPESVYYWPSFEIVKWVGAHARWPAYGLDDGIVRHVDRFLVVNIVRAFIHAFYHADAAAAFDERLAAAGLQISADGQPFVIPGHVVVA